MKIGFSQYYSVSYEVFFLRGKLQNVIYRTLCHSGIEANVYA
ncbi:hypothetical protein DPF89_00267 [Salmonella enterica subsp. enterica serovar Napoli]|nr:hypothetical protein DPF89_00267 [Salmonella enterica subsp. enterica serovar Napoli]